MMILGLATMGESSAALLENGRIVAAAEEERFTRHKHEGCFPIRSTHYCLKEAGISMREVDHVGIYWQPWRVKTRVKGVLASAVKNPPAFLGKLRRSFREFSPAGAGQEPDHEGSWLELFQARKILEKLFGKFKAPIRYLDHHHCHVASAFFVSPFDEALILSFDGAGEEVSTMIAVGEGNRFRPLRTMPWPNSLGHFYSAMTGFLGFQMLDGEYKLMGLASYGKPEYLDYIRKNVLITDQPGSYQLDSRLLDYHEALEGRFSKGITETFGGPRQGSEELVTQRHQAIASSVQAAFEEVVLDLARWGYQAGGEKTKICITGGCGLNCTANGKILSDSPFHGMYVPPAPHDAGCSMGAGLLLYHCVLGFPRTYYMDHAYWGPSFSDHDVFQALVNRGVHLEPVSRESDLLERTASVLAGGGVVGWFQGRMEFGPRALGARSILADPRDDSIREVINQKIKKRELFRPFAPSVKEESVSEYFEIDQESPFMNVVARVKPGKRGDIPAVTHVDGTARLQSVSRRANPRYWELIDCFEKKTGVPVLLNTSFNIQEPIVCTPDEAVDTFLRSQLDALVIENYFVPRQILK